MNKGMSPAGLSALLKGDINNYKVASTPGGIEKQEKDGQNELVNNNDKLPIKFNEGTKEDLENMGVKFQEKEDDIFVKCQLPKGWKIKPTDHSMWSELLDDKDRKRASIFYKAAFYDCHAHISLCTRFTYGYIPEDDYKSRISCGERNRGNWYGIVKDGEKIIFKTESRKFKSDEELWDKQRELSSLALKWLEEKYPDYERYNAYWN